MTTRTTRFRGPALGLAWIVAGAALAPLHAAVGADRAPATKPQQASKHETVGVATGFAVGAAAGGPVGAILGASVGALMGDHYHREVERREALAADLTRSETERAKLGDDLVQTQSHGRKLTAALERARNLETSVSFRTADATLPADEVSRVQKLALVAGSLGEVKVHVDGYADPRGSERFNADLSQRRADAVATLLTEAGLAPERLVVSAHGKTQSTSQDGDLDGYALERRVTLRIEPEATETETVARRD